MKVLHNIGNVSGNSNYNTVEQINAYEGPISFDGIYLNVWQNRDKILPRKDKVILFIMGNYVGKDNEFDIGMPRERYCDWNQIMDLVINYNCELGWHTWSHRDMTTLSYSEIREELKAPFEYNHFAYPYGKFDNHRVITILRDMIIPYAWSVDQGDDLSYLTKKRSYLTP